MDEYLRIGYGPPPEYLRRALDHIHDVLLSIEHSSGMTGRLGVLS
jgi:hypothetical protein